MSKKPDLEAITREAVYHVGSYAEVGRKLNISRAAVSKWRRIPLHQVAQMSRLTGMPAHQLRPDIYREGPEGTSVLRDD